MTSFNVRIEYPTREGVDKAVSTFGQIRHLRDNIDMKVLGHTTDTAGWILFDDMLQQEYKRLQELLKVLEERAG